MVGYRNIRHVCSSLVEACLCCTVEQQILCICIDSLVSFILVIRVVCFLLLKLLYDLWLNVGCPWRGHKIICLCLFIGVPSEVIINMSLSISYITCLIYQFVFLVFKQQVKFDWNFKLCVGPRPWKHSRHFILCTWFCKIVFSLKSIFWLYSLKFCKVVLLE